MKVSRIELQTQNARLNAENDVLQLALSDLCNGVVKWFGNSRTFSIGISRPTGAAGGIAIIRQNGMTSAHYFETYAWHMLEQISMLISGTDDEYNRNLLRQREAIEAAQAYISTSQKAA